MDKCNAVQSRYGGSGWTRSMPVVDFKRPQKPKWPWWVKVLIALAVVAFVVGATLDLTV